jgi:hypothetical protein
MCGTRQEGMSNVTTEACNRAEEEIFLENLFGDLAGEV